MKESKAYRVFYIANLCFLLLLALVCLFPFINILSISLSSKNAVEYGKVFLLPVNPNINAYQYLLNKASFWTAMYVSLVRVLFTTMLSLAVSVLAAFPLSKSAKQFRGRGLYVGYFLISMLFGAGLIPSFLVVRSIGLYGSFWAMVLPLVVNMGNIVLLYNFFRQLPESLQEAAEIDGAGPWRILTLVVLPVSKAVLATVGLFVVVGVWNEWFLPIIYLRDTRGYPLQSYLRGIILQDSFKVDSVADIDTLKALSNKTIQSAQIFVAMLPILLVYPFLQKYFTKGIVLGSVKG